MEQALEENETKGWFTPRNWKLSMSVCRRLNSVEGARERLDDVCVALQAQSEEEVVDEEEVDALFKSSFEVLSSGRDSAINAVSDAVSSLFLVPSLLSCGQLELGRFYCRKAGALSSIVKHHLTQPEDEWMEECFSFLNAQLERW
eukprot:CAMPEP_0113875562 /NCGR_PEP_ID=MMETSP0780_2-20120614/5013_1 /TAXON_ID=652834 /ORGANISM="Palpitomonas bilix" /LENGTH=144 /DNA_ID=CAMNT_0000861569 /DNA_START=6 /DNA_END=437 /DNA_ORIENTATION=+ /assembly_acc=CAM_ASM_000599